jgi:hypothetical protein
MQETNCLVEISDHMPCLFSVESPDGGKRMKKRGKVEGGKGKFFIPLPFTL